MQELMPMPGISYKDVFPRGIQLRHRPGPDPINHLEGHQEYTHHTSDGFPPGQRNNHRIVSPW